MAGTDVIIDDGYCENVAKLYRDKGEQFETLLSNYVTILEQARGNAICDGSAAQALERFIYYASALKGCVEDISTLASIMVSYFVTDVDEVDRELY